MTETERLTRSLRDLKERLIPLDGPAFGTREILDRRVIDDAILRLADLDKRLEEKRGEASTLRHQADLDRSKLRRLHVELLDIAEVIDAFLEGERAAALRDRLDGLAAEAAARAGRFDQFTDEPLTRGVQRV